MSTNIDAELSNTERDLDNIHLGSCREQVQETRNHTCATIMSCAFMEFQNYSIRNQLALLFQNKTASNYTESPASPYPKSSKNCATTS